MSGFNKLDKYKGAVKAVAKKTVEVEVTPEVVPVQSERRSVRTSFDKESTPHAAPRQSTSASFLTPKKDKEDNPFSEPENERNILYLDKAEVNKLIAETDEKPQNDSEPQIKGASLVKLIERATSEKYTDPSFASDFLLTYRSFTTGRTLLSLLIKRYNMPTPKDLSYGELQEWKQNVQKPIRLRVINLLRNWIDKHWKDFTEDPEMSSKMHEFLVEDVQQSGFQTSAEALSKMWDKKRTDPEQEREVVFSEEKPKPFLPNMKNKSSSTQLGLLDFHSEEIARQLTLMEYNLYKVIKPWEFFNQGWSKKNKEINSPNILKMITRFNEVSRWVTTEIVKTEQLKQRIQVLGKFLEIAEKCRQYNNFNALMEIISGLNSSAVYRLRQTWRGLPSKQKELYEELKELMSRQGNYAQLRKEFKQCNPPLIPYLGLYLTDLTFIEDGNTDLIEGGLINWVKRRRLAAVLKDIQQYQFKPYCLEDVSFIQEYLLNYVPMDEDGAYKMSLQRETRSAEPEEVVKEKKPLFSFKKSSKDTPSGSGKDPKDKKDIQKSKPQEEETEEDDEFEIQYKAGYKFYDKDSEHNIIVEKDPKGEANDVIVAGTLSKLVERLTYEKYPDVNYMTSFLLTFRSFMGTHELMDLLTMRYHIPPPVNTAQEVMEKFKSQKETPIQLRVLNVCKIWVDKHFEDFKEDKTLLNKLLEFIEKSMMSSTMLSRGGQNLKAQILNKLDAKEDKKEYQFDKEPPTPILPTVENPKFLDYSPEELARQFTQLDYDLLTSIKPLEYLYLVKPSSWLMEAEDQGEEDPQNTKNSPHVVQVIYRFSDVRDWVLSQIVKANDKETRAKVIEHFVKVAQHCLTLNNFHTLFSIMAALNLEIIQKLKSTWKLIPRPSLETYVKLRDLVSYRQNFKALRDKMSSVDFPAIPYIGMYIQDIATIKEQVPDTIEPGSLINFAKRQKLAELIYSISTYCQQPYCLQNVASVQNFLRQLEIFERSDIANLAEEFLDKDGDRDNAEDVFAGIVVTDRVGIRQSQNLNGSPNNSMSLLPGIGNKSGSPRPSVSQTEATDRKTSGGSSTIEVTSETPTETPKSISSPAVSRFLMNRAITEGGLKGKLNPGAVAVLPTTPNNTPVTPQTHNNTSTAPTTTQATTAPTQATSAPTQVTPPSAQITTSEVPDAVDTNLLKVYPGSKVVTWKVTDTEGTVYGWPGEDIVAKVVTRNNDLYVVPLFSEKGNARIDKAELSLCIRIGHLYEALMKQKPTKVVAFAHQVADSVRPISSKAGVQVILAPNTP